MIPLPTHPYLQLNTQPERKMPCCNYCCQKPSFGNRGRICRRNPVKSSRRHGHICHVCGNAFYTALEADEHFKIVHGYSCSFCQKKCRSSGGLKLHQKIHRTTISNPLRERSWWLGHAHGGNDGDDDDGTKYNPEINELPSRRRRFLERERKNETYDETGPNPQSPPSSRVCHNCSRPFGRTSAYVHHLENSRCGPGGIKIFGIIKRLDRDNLITCPPSLKTRCKFSFQRPGVCFPCPQGPSFENNKADMETHMRKGDHSRLGGGGSNSDLSSANGNGWKPTLTTDNGEAHYICRRCGKEFSVLSGLIQHIESQACKEGRRWAVDYSGVKWEDMVKAIGII
ncbi:hypothetical protein TWF679_007516 [Orbilia oligospora]|uniref:C2H2-type domain-containing protein n=1 Tax=Orbilia oligospora TaxID=2813651 RepID=A0A8H8V786_ORBOL|nr:hypothetical protein TWF679_007516 [Orbilia oligospora]